MTPRARTAGIRLLAAACAAVLLTSCGAPSPDPVEAAQSILEARVGPAATEVPVRCRNDRLCGSDVLPAFYRGRSMRPAWIDGGLVLSNAASFLDALRLVSGDGLNPENYHLAALESLFSEVRATAEKDCRKVRPDTLADLEMLLTDAFLLCASHLVHGQVDPETFEPEWFIKGRFHDLAAALEKGLAEEDVAGALDSLRPKNAVYKGLKRALQVYGKIVARGGWPGFPSGPKLKKGDRSARVEGLANTLAAMGDLNPTEGGDRLLFDDKIEEAVKSFQRRHGLKPDGVVGSTTAAALNVPASFRLAQIRANLERWRWITRDLGERYILINVADFRVGVFEGEREVLSMPAIVGRAYRQTPEFSGKLSYIEINPAWNVPPKLAREDILPKVQKDPGYLREKGIRVFRGWAAGAPEIDPDEVDWSQVKAETLSFKFYQDPGPENALGRIKFIFPNKFDVYLHDTPERWLFARATRGLSSGCIRIERPLDLAEYVLRGDPDWNREKILEAMDGAETRIILVRARIGVHLLYWTAWLAGDGRVQFREDIYLRDAALYRALEQHASPSGSAAGSPRPDAADVDMDKIRPRIDAHSPAPQ